MTDRPIPYPRLRSVLHGLTPKALAALQSPGMCRYRCHSAGGGSFTLACDLHLAINDEIRRRLRPHLRIPRTQVEP